jgi:hypothetical protein
MLQSDSGSDLITRLEETVANKMQEIEDVVLFANAARCLGKP